VAEEHGLIEQTVRNWLSRDTGGKSAELLELSRLKRENEALLQLVGRLTLDGSVRGKNLRRRVHRFTHIRIKNRLRMTPRQFRLTGSSNVYT
jgi:hypothetical protein